VALAAFALLACSNAKRPALKNVEPFLLSELALAPADLGGLYVVDSDRYLDQDGKSVPAPSKNVALGADWIKDFTSTDAEKGLQAKGNIPNATSLLGTSVNERAAARSWFVPAAKHWVDVENGNILRNMLAQILRGKLTVAQAASSASDNITSVLNGS